MTFRLGMSLCMLIVACFNGCGKPPEVTRQPVESSMQSLVIGYGQYLARNQGKSPPNEEAFRRFLEKLSDDERKQMGIGAVSEVFRSPRDEQPYVIRYGVTIPPPGPGGAAWIAHEKEGKEGKRFVAFATGQIREVDEAGFQEITKAK